MFIFEKKAQIKDLFLYPINSSRLSQHPILVQKHWHENYSLNQSRSAWRQDRWCNQHWVIDIRRQVLFLQPLSHWRPSDQSFYTSCLSFPPVLVDCLAHLQKEVAELSCLVIVSGKGWFQCVNLQCNGLCSDFEAETGWQRKNPKSPLPSISQTNSLHFCHQLFGNNNSSSNNNPLQY